LPSLTSLASRGRPTVIFRGALKLTLRQPCLLCPAQAAACLRPLRRSSVAREALDNRSPVEAAPCTNWELRALTGAAEGLSRVSLVSRPANALWILCWVPRPEPFPRKASGGADQAKDDAELAGLHTSRAAHSARLSELDAEARAPTPELSWLIRCCANGWGRRVGPLMFLPTSIQRIAVANRR